MPDVKYPKNPNSDTAFVEEDGKRTRAIKVAVVDGTIDYPKNANSDSCYVTIDGKKQRALMVADVSGEGTVEYPNNPNSTKGYVEIDGKKQRVVLTASLAGGGAVPDVYRVFDENGGVLTNSTTTPFMPFPSSVTNIGGLYLYAGAYQNTPNTVISGKIDLSNIVTISGQGAFSNAFWNCDGITEVDLSGLETISGSTSLYAAFADCQSLATVRFDSLTTISGYQACMSMFSDGNTQLTSIAFPSLTTISGASALSGAFDSSGLITADLSALTTVGRLGLDQIFTGCAYLTSVDLSSLTNLGWGALRYAFMDCPSLTSISFPALTSTSFGANTNQFNFMLSEDGVTLHFPSNVQSEVEALDGYPDFGGTNTTVLFDLPATE